MASDGVVSVAFARAFAGSWDELVAWSQRDAMVRDLWRALHEAPAGLTLDEIRETMQASVSRELFQQSLDIVFGEVDR